MYKVNLHNLVDKHYKEEYPYTLPPEEILLRITRDHPMLYNQRSPLKNKIKVTATDFSDSVFDKQQSCVFIANADSVSYY